MDRAASLLRIAIFLLLITVPLLALRTGPVVLSSEKRAAADFPWPSESGPYPERFDAYFRDRFGFRGQAIRWHRRLAFDWLHDPSIGSVAVGGDGRLFYTGRDDGIDMRDFAGRWPHEEALVDRWASWQADMSRRYAERGIRYLLVLSPNKQSIYPESVPATFGRPAPGMLDRLLAKLRAHPELAALDLRPVLRAHRSESVYYRTDTHWNPRGAFYAAQAVVERLRDWFPDVPALAEEDYRVSLARIPGGDLAVMLGLEQRFSEMEPVFERLRGQPATETPTRDGSRAWEGPAGRRRLLLVGDSFGKALGARLADVFGRTRFVNPWRAGKQEKTQFDILDDLVAEEHPDVVVYELVERYLIHLAP